MRIGIIAPPWIPIPPPAYGGIEYFIDVLAVELAAAGHDVLCLTFSGLSKAYRVCGYRAGWMAISGPKKDAADYLEGISLLANMRLCANVPAQHAIQTALGGYQSINDLILPGGRLLEQRNKAYDMLNAIPGVSTQQARVHSTFSRNLTPRSTTSATTRSSSWTCSGNKRSWCPMAGRSTGSARTTSAWSPCPTSRTSKRPWAGWGTS